ncbi:hypothetical protein RZR38_05185 [Citrobacter freundii]|uniref:hypothetical protein n=1 Tax=Enterobacteriaceae TaxID=543 RepID=UPI0015B01656|nr:hypothetical protein [Citrobacter freundii]EEF9166557.1 hypothetical protein [Salmonella enterica]EHB5923167.1 hypothetical protein [Escherichia coli]EEF9244367.1 hypothetical protein [Salmonella enterica]EEF9303667.1 hypothetical protein [Salmonella enterica]EEF9307973.1 hypothetical protein [Salmonella enterica]
MQLKCPLCGSQNTRSGPAWKLADATNDERLLRSSSGNINPEVLPEILEEIIKVIKKLLGYLEQREKNNAPVLICKECGYYERI